MRPVSASTRSVSCAIFSGCSSTSRDRSSERKVSAHSGRSSKIRAKSLMSLMVVVIGRPSLVALL